MLRSQARLKLWAHRAHSARAGRETGENLSATGEGDEGEGMFSVQGGAAKSKEISLCEKNKHGGSEKPIFYFYENPLCEEETIGLACKNLECWCALGLPSYIHTAPPSFAYLSHLFDTLVYFNNTFHSVYLPPHTHNHVIHRRCLTVRRRGQQDVLIWMTLSSVVRMRTM